MIQLTVVTTLFGAMSAAAAIDEGLLGEAGERVLVVANNAPIPEAVPSLVDTPGADAVLSRFDRVIDLGALLSPQRPSRWTVDSIDMPTQEKLLRGHWGLGESAIHLVLESVHVPPAATMAAVFNSARITVLSEGLMSYGPTRDPQSHPFGQRLTGMVYLDLVDGLDPLLLSEHGVDYHPIAPEAFARLVQEVCDAARILRTEHLEPTVLVLGQYLAALRLITPVEELAMQTRMLGAARELGAKRVLFKPHPSAPSTDTNALMNAAHDAGLEIELVDPRLSAEAVMATHRLVGAVAGFSTALATARRVFDLPTKAVGAEAMFGTLKPFENSNRIPLTIVDFLDNHGTDEDAIDHLRRLTVAVAYAMQPEVLAHRRAEAVAFLETCSGHERTRYFHGDRINKLRLPEAATPRKASRVADGVVMLFPPTLSRAADRYLRRARAKVASLRSR